MQQYSITPPLISHRERDESATEVHPYNSPQQAVHLPQCPHTHTTLTVCEMKVVATRMTAQKAAVTLHRSRPPTTSRMPSAMDSSSPLDLTASPAAKCSVQYVEFM